MTEPKRAWPQKLLGVSPSFIVDDVVKPRNTIVTCSILASTAIGVSRPALSSSGAILLQGVARPSRKAHPEVVRDAYVCVTDVEVLRNELTGRGAKVIRGPASTFYHTRAIEGEDCNGYVLCFSENVPQ